MIGPPQPSLESEAAGSTGWIKAAASDSGGNCVEVNFVGEEVWVRDSKHLTGPVLKYTRDEWLCFRKGILDGDFDKHRPNWLL